MEDICRLWHLLSNGVIENIVLRDLDLHFEDQNSVFYISETFRASGKMHGIHFVILTIAIEWCHWYDYTL